MQINISSPTKAFLEEYTPEELENLIKALTYTNTSNQHMLKRHYNNKWLRAKNKDAWEKQLENLKNSVKFTLIYEEDGKKFIRPGSIPYLKTQFDLKVNSAIKYPTPKAIPWNKPLPFDLHDYQQITNDEMILDPHSSGELCTGAGKTATLLKLCRETGFRTAIVAPYKINFDELVEKFEKHLGRGNVGTFGDGKKTLGKRFTICIGDSLANVKPGTPEWEFFSKLDMLAVDESHTWGAESLDEICHGVFANVPVRHFFSGTQTRGDGAEKLLQSIIGRIVYELPTWLAVEKGYISKHSYKIIELESSNPNFHSNDALEMKRIHFLRNRNICAFIAKLANTMATTYRQQTLILVEELSQISMLLPLLKVPVVYAHSESKKDRLAELGLEKVDRNEAVEKFNKAEAMVLIGTSCISTGTNIYPTHHTANWVGGASEIRTAQGAVGRSVRLHNQNPWADRCVVKESSTIWDFDVWDVYVMKAHLEKRLIVYGNSRSEIKRIKLS